MLLSQCTDSTWIDGVAYVWTQLNMEISIFKLFDSKLRKKLGCRQPNLVTGFRHSNIELYIGKLDTII
jgi:hypothetical protein